VEEVASRGSPAHRLRSLDVRPQARAGAARPVDLPRGIASFDAPVSGGIRGAERGTLAIMAGGPQALWGELEPLLARIGQPFYLGETPGAGQVAKLANNLLSLAAIATTAEAMALAIKAGLDPARMIEVLNAGTGANSATRDKWPRAVLPRTFDFGFSARLSLKDTRLALDEARAMGVPLPTGERLEALLERVLAAYGDDADFTEMAKVVEADAGLDPDGRSEIPPRGFRSCPVGRIPNVRKRPNQAFKWLVGDSLSMRGGARNDRENRDHRGRLRSWPGCSRKSAEPRVTRSWARRPPQARRYP
jgi:hypothetical protein